MVMLLLCYILWALSVIWVFGIETHVDLASRPIAFVFVMVLLPVAFVALLATTAFCVIVRPFIRAKVRR